MKVYISQPITGRDIEQVEVTERQYSTVKDRDVV